MKLIEVLIALILFMLLAFGVMSQLDAGGKVYLHRFELLKEKDVRILNYY